MATVLNPKSAPALAPETPLDEAVRMVAGERLATLDRLERRARSGIDVKLVHDMRVQSRQLRLLLRMLKKHFDPDAFRSANERMSHFIRTLGAVRDYDVLLEETAVLRKTMDAKHRPMLSAFEEHLSACREVAGKTQARYFDAMEHRLALDAARQLVDSFPAKRKPIEEWTRKQMKRGIRKFTKAAGALELDSPDDDWHAARKDARRVRYACEFVRPLLSETGKALRKDAKLAQDHLGRHQDATVLRSQAHAWLDSIPEPSDAHRDFVKEVARIMNERCASIRERFDKEYRGILDGYSDPAAFIQNGG